MSKYETNSQHNEFALSLAGPRKASVGSQSVTTLRQHQSKDDLRMPDHGDKPADAAGIANTPNVTAAILFASMQMDEAVVENVQDMEEAYDSVASYVTVDSSLILLDEPATMILPCEFEIESSVLTLEGESNDTIGKGILQEENNMEDVTRELQNENDPNYNQEYTSQSNEEEEDDLDRELGNTTRDNHTHRGGGDEPPRKKKKHSYGKHRTPSEELTRHPIGKACDTRCSKSCHQNISEERRK